MKEGGHSDKMHWAGPLGGRSDSKGGWGAHILHRLVAVIAVITATAAALLIAGLEALALVAVTILRVGALQIQEVPSAILNELLGIVQNRLQDRFPVQVHLALIVFDVYTVNGRMRQEVCRRLCCHNRTAGLTVQGMFWLHTLQGHMWCHQKLEIQPPHLVSHSFTVSRYFVSIESMR